MPKKQQNLGRKSKTLNPRVELMKQAVQNADGAVPFMLRCNKCGMTALISNAAKSAKFPISFSEINKGNNGRLPVCKACMDELYEKYYAGLHDEEQAFRRVCMKYDIYYSKAIVDLALSNSKPKQRMSYYVNKTTNAEFANKTYDDTINEEQAVNNTISTFDDLYDKEKHSVSEESVKFWGFGFSPEDYEYLDNKYVEWTTSYPVQAKAMESIFQKICMMELQILKGIQNNEKIDALYNQLNNFMNAAGIQPKQNSENTLSDTASFGVLIKQWEDNDPIPEPDPRYKDIDGIRRYISVWFLGHLSKMFGFKNEWSQLYEDEIKKYTVKDIDYSEENVNSVSYEDLFGKGDSDE